MMFHSSWRWISLGSWILRSEDIAGADAVKCGVAILDLREQRAHQVRPFRVELGEVTRGAQRKACLSAGNAHVDRRPEKGGCVVGWPAHLSCREPLEAEQLRVEEVLVERVGDREAGLCGLLRLHGIAGG